MIFGLCADYPPFEYYSEGQLVGFDVELAQKIAEQMNKEAEFVDMNFTALFPALENNIIDAAISTIAITDMRSQAFDFSIPYHQESIAVVSKKADPIQTRENLEHKKIAAQIGTTMEIWFKEHIDNTALLSMDSNPSAVEALKSGHVDGVLLDAAQAASFCENNVELTYHIIGQADNGYAIAFKKGSTLVDPVNKALHVLIETGELSMLKEKYLKKSLS